MGMPRTIYHNTSHVTFSFRPMNHYLTRDQPVLAKRYAPPAQAQAGMGQQYSEQIRETGHSLSSCHRLHISLREKTHQPTLTHGCRPQPRFARSGLRTKG